MVEDLILIDFSWVYNKYYFVATSQADKNTDVKATVTKMLYEFFSRIPIAYNNPTVILALDSATKSTENFALNEEYKQNRAPESKKEVYKDLPEIVKKLHASLNSCFSFVKAKGYEADQVLAYICKKYHSKKRIILYSGDKDLIQLTSYPNVHISDKFSSGRFIEKTDAELFEKFKNSKGEDFTRISTNKKDILKYRSLKGDPSDNLKPVFPRIKDTEIKEIIQNYWVENQEEGLTEEHAEKILEDLNGDNPKLAEKLKQNVTRWVTNYKIMNLLDVEDVPVSVLK